MKTTYQKKISNSTLHNIILKHQDRPGKLLSILEDAQQQNKYNYLPEETLQYISKKTETTFSQVYSVATFYAFFNLKPQGKHTITICRGTACHTRGSKRLLKFAKAILNIKEARVSENEPITTKDNKFTIRTVACFGQCALAPVVEIDGKIYGHINEEKFRKIIESVGKGKRQKNKKRVKKTKRK